MMWSWWRRREKDPIKRDGIIYEYQGDYYVIQRARKNQNSPQSTRENTALTAIVPADAALSQIGMAARAALSRFDQVLPTQSPWKIRERRNQLCGWMGARSYPTLVKNCRMVLLEEQDGENFITVTPFDNHRLNPWETPLAEKAIQVEKAALTDEVGVAVRTAFWLATYHPGREDETLLLGKDCRYDG